MAYIELVIKIPEGLKNDFVFEHWTALSCMAMKTALERAIQLPKGHWIEGNYHIRCSECGEDYTYRLRNYCPNCGAKMVKSQESEDK